MSTDEFARLSPRQWAELSRQHSRHEKLADIRTGLLAMVMAQGLLPRRDKRPWRISDFVSTDEVEQRKQSLQDMIATVKFLKAVFNG